MSSDFPPTRAAARERLLGFVPQMGLAYAQGRNTDCGPDAASSVSKLSPYVRHRLLLEEELVQAAIAAHGAAAAQRFIDEVMWRTYWKGWLEHHPAVWRDYRAALQRDRNRLAVEGGLRRTFHDATEGRTGIDCFDAWARELVATNWLHNHARMWFASIWIFTLRLPWPLGADFFLRYLLDGDAASNTLSWRWVAGLHTRGKCYVARAGNIARFTQGRFNPAGLLDEAPEALADEGPAPLAGLPSADPPPVGTFALLVHDEDCLPETLPLPSGGIASIGYVSAHRRLASSGVAAHVANFTDAAVRDAAMRLGGPACALDPEMLAGWVLGQDHEVVTAYAPVGPMADLLAGLPIRRVRRRWDTVVWPHAARGYFQLKSQIPAILETLEAPSTVPDIHPGR